jgi:2-haloacid dehalogenase
MKVARARPEVVVFDLGNVLISWDRRLLYASMFEDEAELDHFLGEVYTLEANDRLDRGQPLAAFCVELAAAHPRYEAEIMALRDRWIETIGPVVEGTVEILAELTKRGVPCYALSNWNADTYRIVEERYDFLGWFDGVTLSGREGITKPDPEIFRRMFRAFGIDPARALFIDDSAVNVEAARRLEMDAVVFTEPDALRRELHVRGLLG